MSDKKPDIFKLDLDTFDLVYKAAEKQLEAVRHSLEFYFKEKPDFLDTIALLSDLLSINYRLMKEMDIMKATAKIEEGKIFLQNDDLTLLEAATLAKMYAAGELKRACNVSVYCH
jgi:hypothetical protein|tara:strand:+ start:933 stop:1277 length:345 start_codon:yes stop_codon:yes gene_type:complete